MIDLERDGDVFVLRMRGGENRISRAFVSKVSGALDEVEASEGDAALVTTGEGKFYSNGLDLQGLAGAPPDEAGHLMAELHALFGRLLGFPMVTVAAINGHAFAAGLMLAFAHDFRVMRADRGYLCLPEIDLGTGRPLTPGMYALLQARLQPHVLHEALITGRRYTSDDALDRALVSSAPGEADVVPQAVELARGLAGKDRATMAAIKRGNYAAALDVLAQPISETLF